MQPKPPRIGLALGSGSARGWSHIGVINALERAGIAPDIVCGTSIGALVGAAYAAGEHGRLEPWVRGLKWQSVVGLLDWKLGGGLMAGGKLAHFFRSQYDDPGIEQLPKAFGCVATDLASGREVWLREGPVIDAVRASIALPGLFTPAQHDGRLLVDGGLVNPVPVSLCRAMGADIVIAVDLNWELVTRRRPPLQKAASEKEAEQVKQATALTHSGRLEALLARMWPFNGTPKSAAMPSMLGVMSASLNIMQVRITQSRLAGEPADAMIRPRLPDLGAMDFHRGASAIDEGERATELALPMIRGLLA
ncbi:patatin [Acidovorax sp. SRB_14]|uniref:patatin-like phospholipase family protein n=1 Tax=unclassified Acidovorax TaxID=2684926 RepID=UPI00145F62B7|nr:MULTISPECIES: patatin-like phospholipase family protein [unclassified Acidovorax]NMM76175.1 patatin [Acidovorax sp. SRB_24]NMM80939.1 patatin [Acidovorax sp. SRB_14]NMM89242.1 patatin [Rhodococcus sp. SRB_17]